jgi:NAD(P)-dependent dehydrogenase (short-subunit alcohol dehydrogenase family)
LASKYIDSGQIEKYQNLEFSFPERPLEEKVILIPGGTGGLGVALVAKLLSERSIPIVGYRSNQARALHVKNKLESAYGRQIHLVQGDIYELTDRKKYIEAAAQVNGGIQGFACFVGDPARVKFETLKSEDLVESFRSNFIGPILMAKEVGEHMIANKMQGSLVLLSSMQGVGLFESSLNYASPKAGLIHACRILAKQWSGRHNVRINVVAPGATPVGMAESSIGSGKYDSYIETRAVHRFGRPEDIARAVRFLLEPDNYITGQVIVADGGLSLKA